jgi:hypothetical protein
MMYIAETQKSTDNQIASLQDFAIFLIKNRCEIELTKKQVSKVPFKRLKGLMDFFNKETESIKDSEEDATSKNEQTGLPSTGDSTSTIQVKADSVESNSGVAL